MRCSTVLVTALLLATAAVPPACAQHDADGGAARRFGVERPKPRQPGAVRIATYNLLNLFDRVDDPALSGEFDDLPMATSDDRLEHLAGTIRAVDADILALEEIESADALRWFRDTYLADMGYDHLRSEDVGYHRGVEQSVLSRFPITGARTWPGLELEDVRRAGAGWEPRPDDAPRPLRFQRSPLQVDVQVRDDYALTLFVLHHKSGADHRWRREAEALKVLELIDAVQRRDPARNIVVLGDFNAAPWDKSLRVYLEAGLVDTLAHRIIPRWRNAPQDEAALYKTHESDRVIDYVLLNAAAYREYVPGSAHVLGTLAPPPSYDWRTDEPPAGYASDHYPVIIDLLPIDRK